LVGARFSKDEILMNMKPLVTVMIATKDRHEDLAMTVQDLTRQDYPRLEMVVIDDGSTPAIESIVKEAWPDARIIRHDTNRGQNVRRNEGFRLAKGKYILHLDDDCSPLAANAISLSVKYMESNPHCAGIAFSIMSGKEMADNLCIFGAVAGNSVSFVGAAAFFRSKSLKETAGYRDIYFSAGEEEELSLQLLKRGWSLSYRPEIVAHHRCSPMNRNRPATWKRALRNNLWTILIHCRMSRIAVEVGWKVTLGAWDALRLQRGRLYIEALAEAFKGAGTIWKLRDPLDSLSSRRYDALRAYGVLPYEMFDSPPSMGWGIFKRWTKRWRERHRERSIFLRRLAVGRGKNPTRERDLSK
jgi:GT2 family glycosyltransferase